VPGADYPAIVIAWLALLWTPLASAQTAGLRGVVTDVTGAVVPGAKVTVNGPAGAAKATTAGKDGSYSFANLRPGEYTVQASAPDLVLNHNNPGPIVGNVSSPLFGRANSLAGGFFGGATPAGAFSENANDRCLELQVRFRF
jgi:hypothetical protein